MISKKEVILSSRPDSFRTQQTSGNELSYFCIMQEELVVLVDEKDNEIGLMPKMEAHEKAVLHRAFSVFILNNDGELMLQQRAASKYHSPLLWTNTCCSHQRHGEGSIDASKRRLQEEMGFVTEIEELFTFIYKAPFDNGLTEHELDHVLLGYFNDEPALNRDEVEAWKWASLETIEKDMEQRPEDYTAWFKIVFPQFKKHVNEDQ